jgi:hypothetical protein
VSETGTGAVAVIDQAGRYHHFDADDWSGNGDGGVDISKDGKRVATFPHGHLGVYKVGARVTAPVVQVPAGPTQDEGSDAT